MYISFSAALGGELTLGGAGNGNGKLVINNSAGKQIGYIDNTGVHFNQGEFSGSLKAATGTFAGKLTAPTGNIGGWKISNNPQCIYSGDSPGSTGITLYADGRIVADFSPTSGGIVEPGPKFSVSSSGIETNDITLTNVNIDNGTVKNASIEEATIGSGTIAGWKISNDPQCIYSGSSAGSADGITLYASGSITFGGVELGRNGNALTAKYGLHVYNGDETQFSDGSGQFKIFNTAKSTSTATLVMHNQTVYRSSSSSKRYKNHIREVSEEDVQKLFDIPVVYFEYKDGYLSVNDPKVGIPIPGFYAEDMEQAFPDAVLYEDGKVEDWNYRALIPAMEKQIQILCKQNQELIEAIKQLKEDVSHGNKNRRGPYNKFDPTKLLPGEWAVVLSGDPNASDGLACYMCFAPGTVKRMATYEDMVDNIAASSGEVVAAEVDRQCKAAIQACQTAASNAGSAASAANTAVSKANTAANSPILQRQRQMRRHGQRKMLYRGIYPATL